MYEYNVAYHFSFDISPAHSEDYNKLHTALTDALIKNENIVAFIPLLESTCLVVTNLEASALAERAKEALEQTGIKHRFHYFISEVNENNKLFFPLEAKSAESKEVVCKYIELDALNLGLDYKIDSIPRS